MIIDGLHLGAFDSYIEMKDDKIKNLVFLSIIWFK